MDGSFSSSLNEFLLCLCLTMFQHPWLWYPIPQPPFSSWQSSCKPIPWTTDLRWRPPNVHPQPWPSPTLRTHGYTTSYCFFPLECQIGNWNTKLNSLHFATSPDSQTCFCCRVFALVWNSISAGIHMGYFLYSRFLRKCYLNWEAFPDCPT